MTKPKVLYLDDEKENLSSFKYLFKPDFEIFIAQTAEEGLEILKNNEISIVISDQKMPGISGTDFFEKIYFDNPEQIRILLTGYSDLDTIIDAVNKGRIYRYIKKPFDSNEIKLEINKAYEIYRLKKENKELFGKLKVANKELQASASLMAIKLAEESQKNLILEMISKGENLSQTLETIVRFIESMANELICTILLIDESGIYFRNGASPSLPEEYIRAIEKIRIGPRAGSCGTAAFLKKQVIVGDIDNDPLWAAYSQLAAKFNLKACWSNPVFSSDGNVIATFAMYYNKPKLPEEAELKLIETAVHLASIAIEKDKTEKALKESEKLYRLITENSSDIIMKNDSEGKYIYVSPSVKELTGFGVEEILGKTPFDFLPPDDFKYIYEYIKNPFAENGYTCRFKRKDGSFAWLENRIKPVLEPETGEIKEFVMICRDISERKHNEEKIIEQASLLDKAQDAIIVMEPGQEKITYWNDYAAKIYGWSKQETIGEKMVDIPFNPDLLKIKAAREGILSKGEWHGELNQLNRQNQLFIVESRWSLIRDSENKPKSILIINSDITLRKKLEKQTFHSQRMESIGILASGIAHEINNIFTPILISTKFIRKNLHDEKSLQMVDVIKACVERGSGIVKQVLLLARTEEHNFSEIAVNLLIDEVLKIISQTIAKNINIKVDLPAVPWNINGNIIVLHQVLLNICLNASDAIENDSGELSIIVKNLIVDKSFSKLANINTGKFLEIVISDNGTGIPENIIDKIFDPFFTTKEVGKGTGLGLSTSLSIIKNHGGTINVYSTIGAGTSFKIYLPAINQKTVKGILPKRNKNLQNTTSDKSCCILVVDDETVILDIFKEVLVNNSYHVLTAKNGQEAIKTFSENREQIELVIMDINMPLLDGTSAARSIREISPGVPVILSSGSYNYQVNNPKIPGFFFLSKPYTEENLLETIASALKIIL